MTEPSSTTRSEPEAGDDGCAVVGKFMGVEQRCDEPPYSDWHDPTSLSFKHDYEHDCGDCAEVAPERGGAT